MMVFINGEFVPEDRAAISVFDRGFMLGDGLFETLLVHNGVPFCWPQHLQRLERGAAQLRLPWPFPTDRLRQSAEELILQNQMPEAVLRVTLSRGPGRRGYSVAGAGPSTVVMTLHASSWTGQAEMPRWRLATSTVRVVAGDPLAGVKTCSKAAYIAARAEAEGRGVEEALLLNTAGHLAEAASANLFWVEQGCLRTPPLSAGVLPGITRALVLELGKELGVPTGECTGTLKTLFAAEGVFLTSSTWGLVEVVQLDEQPLHSSPLVARLRAAYRDRLQVETLGASPG
jgi:aminodeoxychorismate lyase